MEERRERSLLREGGAEAWANRTALEKLVVERTKREGGKRLIRRGREITQGFKEVHPTRSLTVRGKIGKLWGRGMRGVYLFIQGRDRKGKGLILSRCLY